MEKRNKKTATHGRSAMGGSYSEIEGQVESRVDFTAEFLSFVEVTTRGWDEIHQLSTTICHPDRLLPHSRLACAERTKLTLTD